MTADNIIAWPGRPTDPYQGWVLAGDIPDPGEPAFLIGTEDVPILHEVSTVIYGRPKSGKSMAVLNMILSLMTGEPFMGYPVRETRRVAFWVLDSGQVRETKARMNKTGRKEVFDRVFLSARKPGTSEGEWEREAIQLRNLGVNFLFIDNLARIKGRDKDRSVRRDEDIDPILANIDIMEAHGIGVGLLHHAGKPGEDGMPKSSPLGATTIEAWARHFVRVDAAPVRDSNPPRTNRSFHLYGNDLESDPVMLPFAIGGSGLLIPVQVDEATGKPKPVRTDPVKAKRAKIQEFVLAKHPNVTNKAALGRLIAAEFKDVEPRTASNRLGDGGYNLVIVGDHWELKPAA